MKYHVKWLYPESNILANRVGKEIVEEVSLGVFIVGLTNDKCVIIQVEPI